MAVEVVEVPMTGKIIDVKVSVGDKVQEWGIICVLESMKMENPILAPVAGIIKEVKVDKGQKVRTGDVIAIIEY